MLKGTEITDSISASFLASSLILLLHEVIPRDPKLFIFDHLIIYQAVLVLSVLVILKNPLSNVSNVYYKAIGSITLSVLILDILSILLIPREHIGYIGDAYARDLFAISLLFLTVIVKIREFPVARMIRRKTIVLNKD
ncbi:hypothetical protein [Desulfuribacillus stibiiarsenatis]|nr:hypothetical protein [Desulfuribacillus stibiiarsenatis]